MGISSISSQLELNPIEETQFSHNSPRYMAIGIIQAKYYPSADKFYKGIFETKDANYSGGINHALTKWLKKNPSLLQQTQLWRVYPRCHHSYSNKLIIEAIAVSDNSKSQINKFTIKGKLYKWNQQKKTFTVKVKRNIAAPDRLKNSQLFQPSFLEISGDLPITPFRGQFWEIFCTLNAQKLILVEASLIPTQERKAPTRKSTSTIQHTDPFNYRYCSSMTQARAEITLKFNDLPNVRELPNKRVEFNLATNKGVPFTINIKSKSWRSALKKIEEMESWMGIVKGKLGEATPNGFRLEEAGLQIFEIITKNSTT